MTSHELTRVAPDDPHVCKRDPGMDGRSLIEAGKDEEPKVGKKRLLTSSGRADGMPDTAGYM